MAIVVKHGGPTVGVLSGFGEGQARRAVDTARFTAPKSQLSQGKSGTRSSGVEKPIKPKAIEKLKEQAAQPAPQGQRQYSGWGPGVIMQKLADAGDGAGLAAFQKALNDPSMQRELQQHEMELAKMGYAPKGFTQKQADEWNRMSEAYDEAVQSGEYTQEELADMQHKIRMKQMGIADSPMERKKAEAPTPEQQFQEKTYRDPETGALVGFKPDGTPFKLADAAKAEGVLDDAGLDKLMTQARTELSESGDVPTQEAIIARAKELHRVREKLRQELGGGESAAKPKGQGEIRDADGNVLESVGGQNTGANSVGDVTPKARGFMDRLLGRNKPSAPASSDKQPQGSNSASFDDLVKDAEKLEKPAPAKKEEDKSKA
jgi:hypothetical protein